MKRSLEPIAHRTRSRSRPLFRAPNPAPLPKRWVSATHTRNYILNDPLQDWYKWCAHPPFRRLAAPVKNSFQQFIMQRGVTFENKLVDHIHQTIHPVQKVSEQITDESVAQTKKLMLQGVPLIHSAPVRDYTARTQGIIDLLVRSDYLHRLVSHLPPLPEIESSVAAFGLNAPYHYVVVDIKFSTLPLRVNEKHLLNSGSYPAYKAQCLIYTRAIAQIQGYQSRYAFIMGRRWSSNKGGMRLSGLGCTDRLGVIDYESVDEHFGELTDEAIQWVRDVRQNGMKWTISPPSRPELYPNMCAHGGQWDAQKKELAERVGEITSLWFCGVKHRRIAHQNGITDWRDPRCRAESIGFRGVRAPILNKMLEINRQNDVLVAPAEIDNNLHGWRNQVPEVYVDFETLSDVFASFDDLPHQPRTEMIFLIGVYHRSENGAMAYRSFTATDTTWDEEFRIMNEFVEFMSALGNPKIWYWVAEGRFWRSAERRQFNRADYRSHGSVERTDRISDSWKNLRWFDLCDLFKKSPIVIKGCFNFSLKSVARALHQHGLITTQLDTECQSGMTAMIQAWNCYQNSPEPLETEVMKDIIRYNQFDVQALWDILRYLRTHHRGDEGGLENYM